MFYRFLKKKDLVIKQLVSVSFVCRGLYVLVDETTNVTLVSIYNLFQHFKIKSLRADNMK